MICSIKFLFNNMKNKALLEFIPNIKPNLFLHIRKRLSYDVGSQIFGNIHNKTWGKTDEIE
ncbi:hypothetical protein DDT56_11745 [Brenneria corticis]|uniref:Uncharacterized protein n=1 Tax=Brenneria corticis TaxID=2173106 RepID=A0A2U1U182_9GAMM|nr:hypothetical protein DDT56_11745 [Brenneria sp. CFCC 11842]